MRLVFSLIDTGPFIKLWLIVVNQIIDSNTKKANEMYDKMSA